MQKSKSCIKDSEYFIKNIKNIPEGATLVTVDVVGLYLSIPQEARLKALEKTLDNEENKTTHTQHPITMTSFVFLKKLFELNGKVKHPVSVLL